MTNERANKVWDSCGKSTISGLVSPMKRLDLKTRLGCKWSLVQIQSRRPIYPLEFTTQSRERPNKISARRLVVSCHFSPVVFKENGVPVWWSEKIRLTDFTWAELSKFRRPNCDLIPSLSLHHRNSMHLDWATKGGTMWRHWSEETRAYVYFLETYDRRVPRLIKVGRSWRPVLRRTALARQTRRKLSLVGSIKCANSGVSAAFERAVHEHLSDYQTSGEWFHASPEVLSFMHLILGGARG